MPQARSLARLAALVTAMLVGNQAWLFGGLRGGPVSEILVASIAPR